MGKKKIASLEDILIKEADRIMSRAPYCRRCGRPVALFAQGREAWEKEIETGFHSECFAELALEEEKKRIAAEPLIAARAKQDEKYRRQFAEAKACAATPH